MQHIRPAIVVLVLMTLITGFFYPLAITGVAQTIFPQQAKGSLVQMKMENLLPPEWGVMAQWCS